MRGAEPLRKQRLEGTAREPGWIVTEKVPDLPARMEDHPAAVDENGRIGKEIEDVFRMPVHGSPLGEARGGRARRGYARRVPGARIGSRHGPSSASAKSIASFGDPLRESVLDNLTHSLVGLAIAKAGAERWTPHAAATLVLAANAPDIDVSSYVAGPYFALAFRRGITHGWPALLVLPSLVAGAVLLWDRRVARRSDAARAPARAGPLLALAGVGVLTHPTLDWMNTYGMRWGLPFDGTWSYGDALFIADPWIWLVLGGALFLASPPSRRGHLVWGLGAAAATVLVLATLPGGRWIWLAGLALVLALRRVGLATGRLPGRTVVRAAGGVVCVYIAVLVALVPLARREVFAAAAAAGLAARDVMVAPLPGNPFGSEVEVLTPDGYVPGVHRRLGRPRVALRPDLLVPLLSAPPDLSAAAAERVLAEARRVPAARRWLLWARYPYVRVTAEPSAWRVTFADARYDGPRAAGSLAGVSVRIAREPGPVTLPGRP